MEKKFIDYGERVKQHERQIRESNISEHSQGIILEFKRYLMVNGRSPATIAKYLKALFKLANFLSVDLDKVTKNHIIDFIEMLENNGYQETTKVGHKICIKRFYRWVRGGDETNTYPPEVAWINTTLKRHKRNLPRPEDILSPKDVAALIEVSENLRDRAIVAFLYESGARISELGTLKIGNIVFEDQGAQVLLTGKTGPRSIPIFNSVQYIANWLTVHPSKDDMNAPLWCCLAKNRGTILTYAGVEAVLSYLTTRSGLRKKTNPHAFRHSRASFLANHLTEYQMCQYFGWVQGSIMPSIYVHLSGRDITPALRKANGMDVPEQLKTPEYKPTVCHRCQTLNPAEHSMCCQCGVTLTLTGALEQKPLQDVERSNEIMNSLMKDPEVKALLLEKVRECQIHDRREKAVEESIHMG